MDILNTYTGNPGQSTIKKQQLKNNATQLFYSSRNYNDAANSKAIDQFRNSAG